MSGCNTFTDWFLPTAPSQAVQVPYRDAARVIALNACPVSDDAAKSPRPAFAPVGVGAAVIPRLIEVSSSALKGAVLEFQDDLMATYVAYGKTASLDNSPTCVVIVRGRFGPRTTRLIPTEGRLTPAVLNMVGAIAQPSLYIEIKITTNRKNGEMEFRPVLLQFNNTAAKNPGDGEKYIGVMLAFSAFPLDAKAGMSSSNITKASNVFVPFSFGKIRRGTWLVGNLGVPPSPSDVFFDQIRILPIKAADGKVLPSALDSYAFVTEGPDPTFFEKLFLQAVSSTTVTDDLQKLLP